MGILLAIAATTLVVHAQNTNVLPRLLPPQLAKELLYFFKKVHPNAPETIFTKLGVSYRCIAPKSKLMLDTWETISHQNISESIATINIDNTSVMSSFNMMDMQPNTGSKLISNNGPVEGYFIQNIEVFTNKHEQVNKNSDLKKIYSTLNLSMTDPAAKRNNFWTARLSVGNGNSYLTFINPNTNSFLLETTSSPLPVDKAAYARLIKVDPLFINGDSQFKQNNYLPAMIPFFLATSTQRHGITIPSTQLAVVCYLKVQKNR